MTIQKEYTIYLLDRTGKDEGESETFTDEVAFLLRYDELGSDSIERCSLELDIINEKGELTFGYTFDLVMDEYGEGVGMVDEED